MDEVFEMLSGIQDPVMAKGTLDFFKILDENIKKPEKRPADYREIFEYLMKIKEWNLLLAVGISIRLFFL